jgi:4-amino-4-deoxy-L-arabinose transferase-like glycosyltransferase
MTHPKKTEERHLFFSSDTAWLLIVFGIGLFIRCVAFFNIHIINPDGVLYIFQAKAISNGQWGLLNDCQLDYITLYPFFIALIQPMASDWILSARLVSLFFGFAMLIPLHLVLRQFFSRPISLLTTLMFAFIPVFVRYSVDVMRDASYWFFFAASIWAFLSHARTDIRAARSMWMLVLSSVLALAALATRIEAAILYPAACLFILFSHGDRKAMRLFGFLLPLVLLIGLGVLAAIHSGIDLSELTRLDAVGKKFTVPLEAYQELRGHLKELGSLHGRTFIGEFLANSRHLIWLIAFGAIISNAMESFFYPYVPFFVIGTVAAFKQPLRRSPILYPIIIVVLSSVLLYAHVLQKWIMTYRFIVLLIIPSCVLAGLGMETVIGWMTRSVKLSRMKAVAVVAAFIVVAGLAKNTGPIESDKAIYVDIGSRIAELANGVLPVGIAARRSTVHQWITFYANAAFPGPICHEDFTVNPKSMAKLKTIMRSRGIDYFLWEESLWKNSSFGATSSDFSSDFDALGHWYHDDPGELVLFRLKGIQ